VVAAAEGDGLLSVVCNSPENAVKEWSVVKVTIENGKFVHEGGTFFTLQGALKKHHSLLGIPFVGESIDDYCS
jgi:hypothetical protein